MSTIIQFLEDYNFDPAHVEAMGKAFDNACANVGARDSVIQLIAARIVEIAKAGERDPRVLCRRALETLGLPEAAQAHC